MKILLLAPQPFFQERGTPIAVHWVLKALSKRGDSVDLLTYPEGKDVTYPGLRIFRSKYLPFATQIPLGFSWKKLVHGFFLFCSAFSLCRKNNYDLLHAVEESVFMAMVLKIFFRIPYIYDMDSSLANQLVESRPFLKCFSPLFHGFEKQALRKSQGVLAVCESLVQIAKKQGAKNVCLLPDISLWEESTPGENITEIRKEFAMGAPIALYIGNLEAYQGIDLLLESAALLKTRQDFHLVFIGGTEKHIAFYQDRTKQLGLEKITRFLGPRPLSDIRAYLEQADILLSPRIRGNNTPMKVYTYLHSGKVVLATNIVSHTQILSESVCALADATPETFSQRLSELLQNENERKTLGEAGKKFVEKEYSFSVLEKKLGNFYEALEVPSTSNL
jgi:glycosyltransferase involved in cell wall biosynthesis